MSKKTHTQQQNLINGNDFAKSVAANAIEDEPKSTKENTIQSTSNLTKNQLQFELDKLDSADSKAQSDLAFRLFIILLSLLVILIASSIILHCLNISELKILENCIVFCQGAMTTILGFLFGTKIYRKKL